MSSCIHISLTIHEEKIINRCQVCLKIKYFNYMAIELINLLLLLFNLKIIILVHDANDTNAVGDGDYLEWLFVKVCFKMDIQIMCAISSTLYLEQILVACIKLPYLALKTRI
jgi:hypothetical protein